MESIDSTIDLCKGCTHYDVEKNVKKKNKSRWVYDSENADSKTTLALNPNHSHFIFFNSETKCGYGNEMELRVNLEKELVKQSNSPIVQLVFEGGFLTLRGIELALRSRIPVIILEVSVRLLYLLGISKGFFFIKGTKGCADLIIEAQKLKVFDRKGFVFSIFLSTIKKIFVLLVH
jgi:hypothetical protein